MPTITEVRQQYPQYKDMSDDALASALHSKFYADMPRAEFNEKLGLDPVRAEVRKEYEDMKAKGIPIQPGYSRRIVQGMTLGAADEILAGAVTPLEMIKRKTWDPREGYKYAKAFEDIAMEDARKNQGVLGDVAEVAGGVGSGLGLARSGFTLARQGMGLAGRTGAFAGEGAAYGGTAGFLDGGNSIDERLSGAGKGAAIGGGIGAALPVGGAAVGTVLAPIASNVRARINPQGVAVSQVARALDESRRPIGDVINDVTQAAAEGQGMYTVADSLGNSGQRMLSTVTRAPGPGRTQAVEYLDARQAGQSRRVGGALAEGFDSPETAAQTRAALTERRAVDANTNYGQARSQAGAVDVTPAIEAIDRTLQPGVTRFANPQSGIADDSIEGMLRRARSYLTDGRSQVSRFDEAFRVKMELDHLIDGASSTQQRALIPVRNALDDQLAASSGPYQRARDIFRQQSQNIEAVDQGATAAARGRTEDTVPAFQAMRPDRRQAFRSGYVDPLIAQTQGAAFGVNAARPFTSPAFQTEAAAMAPGNPLMQRRLGREMRMFETRNHATGNSRTADNLADQNGMRVDPSIVAALLGGDFRGAARQGLGHASNALHGYTPTVRQRMAEILLQNGGAPSLQTDIADQVGRSARVREIAAILSRAAMSGTSVGAGPSNQKK